MIDPIQHPGLKSMKNETNKQESTQIFHWHILIGYVLVMFYGSVVIIGIFQDKFPKFTNIAIGFLVILGLIGLAPICADIQHSLKKRVRRAHG